MRTDSTSVAIKARKTALCGVLAAALTCSAAPAARADPSVRRPTQQRMVAAVDDQLATKHFPGAIVGVQRGSATPWIVARGVSDLETRAPMRSDEHVRIGSVTKSFVTTLLLRLAQEGKLSLDDPIS